MDNKVKSISIGQLLIQRGDITEQQLNEALDYQKDHKGRRLAQVLIDLGYISEETKIKVLAERFNVSVYEGSEMIVAPEIAQLVSESLANKYTIMPLELRGNNLLVATNDPLDLQAFEDIKANCGLPVEITLAPESMIKTAINMYYSQVNVTDAIREIQNEYQNINVEDSNDLAIEDRVDNAPVVKFINNLIKQAFELGASDVHIEPFDTKTVIRFRIDGVLNEFTTISSQAHEGLITRLKIMGGMNIAERRVPQDGRIDMSISNSPVDIRISSLPTIYGEKVVIRILGHTNKKLDRLEDLGIDESNLAILKKVIKNPYGIILVTGPTGSGKTTSLYSILNEVMSPSINIVTVEDPVEKRIFGINQVQVNNKAGLTFANGLRSILRQDPDVIMIGEIRDSETAEIAVSSAITGHLVLSTIHTNDTATTINRLVDMGIEPYLLSSAILGIVAQRLVRVVCPHCRKKVMPTAQQKKLFSNYDGPIYQAVGCPQCNGTGYKGRTAIFEIMIIDPTIREMIANQTNSIEIKKYATSIGMKSIANNMINLVKEGVTTVDELIRVVYNVN